MLQQMLQPALKKERGAETLSQALYVQRRKERAAQITHTNNYPFFTAQILELPLEVNMASRTKHG
jgi:hypothetical protein